MASRGHLHRADVVRRAGAIAAGFVAVAAGCALLDRVAEAFEVARGVALVFPAAAVAVVGALLLGWWGVVASFVGFLVFPWGLETTLARTVYFALAGSLLALVPTLARLRAEGEIRRRVLRFVLYAALLNTLASAVVGIVGVAAFSAPALGWRRLLGAFTSWFVGDMVTIVVIAFPVVLLVRPRLLLSEYDVALMRRWAGRAGLQATIAAMLAGGVVLLELAARGGGVNIHWVALVLVVPVLLGATTGGVGGGLFVNGLAGIVYIAEVLRLVVPATQGGLFQEVVSSYLNLVVFALAALVAGLYAARSGALLAELDEHRRLLQQSFEQVVTSLAAAIEAKDQTTEGHVQRVAGLTVAAGRALGIEGRPLELLRYAAILHDVGKIGVPESILNKPSELSAHEVELMQAHVGIGVDILSPIEILKPAIPFIRYHQERWDGRADARYPGYFGLKGEEIPLEARIIAVVDAFDAMVSDRPYRPALGRERALAELREGAGKQFDPEVVAVLCAIVEGGLEPAASGRWPVLGEVEHDGWVAR